MTVAWRRRLTILSMMSPWLVGFTVFFGYPLVSTVYLSFTHYDLLKPARGRVSWISPIATALLKASVGDVVTVRTPRGPEELEVLAIRYDELP